MKQSSVENQIHHHAAQNQRYSLSSPGIDHYRNGAMVFPVNGKDCSVYPGIILGSSAVSAWYDYCNYPGIRSLPQFPVILDLNGSSAGRDGKMRYDGVGQAGRL